ncbi:hypothetical protein LEP1GSC046_3230 [Leptospira kirschneri serovar Bim str. 1051]|nr:hypothetical protein LEP1GSC042_3093 [Leptospira kirschneri serovar Bim str. PUO 1247]EMN03221.1 hypothetical protein LEP1GSC046_3230 [Leptospira kirschneri serovar Bim str. 1051]
MKPETVFPDIFRTGFFLCSQRKRIETSKSLFFKCSPCQVSSFVRKGSGLKLVGNLILFS